MNLAQLKNYLLNLAFMQVHMYRFSNLVWKALYISLTGVFRWLEQLLLLHNQFNRLLLETASNNYLYYLPNINRSTLYKNINL